MIQKRPDVCAKYLAASRETASVAAQVNRLESLKFQSGSSDTTEDRIRKLSEMYFQLRSSQEESQKMASFLNYSDTMLRTELGIFHEYRATSINRTLNNYVDRQLTLEKDIMQAIQNCFLTI